MMTCRTRAERKVTADESDYHCPDQGDCGDTVKLLTQAGFDMSFMADKGRSLIFESPDSRFRFLLVKGPDVTTYVRHGVADLGIVGKDILFEHPTGYLAAGSELWPL